MKTVHKKPKPLPETPALPTRAALKAFLAEAPGKVGLREIARAFNVGPELKKGLRGLVRSLEGEGLLVRAGARSYSVRSVQAEEYFQAMKVRELLECEAVGLAIGKIDKKTVQQLVKKTKALSSGQQENAHWQIDDQIHTMMARASGNDVLARMIDVVRTNSRLFELVSPFNRIEEDRAEHLAILEAYLADDAAAARAAVRCHLQNLRRFVLDRLAEGTDD